MRGSLHDSAAWENRNPFVELGLERVSSGVAVGFPREFALRL